MVKELRVRAQLKQTEVAKAIGLASSSYGFMERGARPWRGEYKEKAIAYLNSILEKKDSPQPTQEPDNVTPDKGKSNLILTTSNAVEQGTESWKGIVKFIRTSYPSTQFEVSTKDVKDVVSTCASLGCLYVTVTWRAQESIELGRDSPLYLFFAEEGAAIIYTVRDSLKYLAKQPTLISILNTLKEREL